MRPKKRTWIISKRHEIFKYKAKTMKMKFTLNMSCLKIFLDPKYLIEIIKVI